MLDRWKSARADWRTGNSSLTPILGVPMRRGRGSIFRRTPTAVRDFRCAAASFRHEDPTLAPFGSCGTKILERRKGDIVLVDGLV